MSGIKAGDEVRVTDSGMIIPREYPGRVVYVGRKLVTITWNGREEKFRLADRCLHDGRADFHFEPVLVG